MMLKRWSAFGGLLTATALVLLLIPATSAAAPRGGGGGGRSYGGRSYGTYGGYSGYGWGGYNRGYGFYPGSYGTYGGYSGYGYPRNYGYFRTYPDYSGYYTDESYQPQIYSSSGPATTYQSFYPPAPNTAVTVDVHVPDPNADVWIENSATRQRGMDREFTSPPLDSGRTYTYHIRARWMENGQERDQTRNVDIQAGQRVNVDFTQPQPTEAIPTSPKPTP